MCATGKYTKQQPGDQKQQVRLEGDPVRKRPGDQRRRDLREHHLVGHEHDQRNGGRPGEGRGRGDAMEERHVEVPDHAADVGIGGIPVTPAERHRIPAHHPEHGRDAHRHEALDHDGEHVLPAHQTAIEERQSRGHQHHQAGGNEHEPDVACIPVHQFPL